MPFPEFFAALPWAVNVLIVLVSIAGYIGLFLIANGLFCAMMDAIGRRLDGPLVSQQAGQRKREV